MTTLHKSPVAHQLLNASARHPTGAWVVARCNDEFQTTSSAPISMRGWPSVFGTFGARAKRVDGGIQVVLPDTTGSRAEKREDDR